MGARRDKKRPITNKTHVTRIPEIPTQLAEALVNCNILTLGAMKNQPDTVRGLIRRHASKQQDLIMALLRPSTPPPAPRAAATSAQP